MSQRVGNRKFAANSTSCLWRTALVLGILWNLFKRRIHSFTWVILTSNLDSSFYIQNPFSLQISFPTLIFIFFYFFLLLRPFLLTHLWKSCILTFIGFLLFLRKLSTSAKMNGTSVGTAVWANLGHFILTQATFTSSSNVVKDFDAIVGWKGTNESGSPFNLQNWKQWSNKSIHGPILLYLLWGIHTLFLFYLLLAQPVLKYKFHSKKNHIGFPLT